MAGSAAAPRRVLMVAFHFPPQRGSSGIQRTLRFARYLPEFGWEPHVLTVDARAYDAVDESEKIPAGIAIHRTPALDAARHLAIRNRYPSVFARPDRWKSWWWSAVPAGLVLVRRLRPDAIWSTYPIATAHMIGHTLARVSHIPWIADFRDPMAQDGYPPDPATWRSFARIEARSLARAHASVFTTASAAQRYRLRYPAHAQRVAVIENGYDEELFSGLPGREDTDVAQRLVLVHSGIVYPDERNPSALFGALRKLRDAGRIDARSLAIRFRAPVHDEVIRDLAARSGVADLIEVAEPLRYRDALAEMLKADALLILQGANCNEQIPAKLYEYLRAGRPILGLASGDTRDAMRVAGVNRMAALENTEAIAATLQAFIDDLRAGRAAVPDPRMARGSSRRARTSELARILNEVAGIS